MGTRPLESGKIFIVCEGEKTEPYFCRDLILEIENKSIEGFRMSEVDVFRMETNDDENELKNGRNSSQKKRPLPEKVEGSPPLSWVDKGIEGLEQYSEVWVLFDNDNHPARAEAFKKAREVRESGGNLSVAYSSWSFEYYLLLHYQYLYHAFTATEHRGNVVQKNGETKNMVLDCCKANPKQGACDGIISNNPCINGYARKQGYWIDSKKLEGTKMIFRGIGNIWKGICNAHTVKWETIRNCYMTNIPQIVFCDLNPYLDTYRMVLRLMKVRELSYEENVLTNNKLKLSLIGNTLNLENDSESPFLLKESHVTLYEYDLGQGKFGKKEVKHCCERIYLNVGEKHMLALQPNKPNDYYLIDFGLGEKFFLRLQENVPSYTGSFLKQFQYSSL